MLTHPSGRFMAIEAIRGLNLDDFEVINFVYLQEHQEKHKFLKGFNEELEDLGLLNMTRLIALEKPTADQPETVLQAINMASIKGPILIKDSDNYFEATVSPSNCVCSCDLNSLGLVKARNKSYISLNSMGKVANIVEKQVISSTFCVGGYGFKDASVFEAALGRLGPMKERYISNVIYDLLLQGQDFESVPVKNYSDWGTIEDWDRYKRTFGTLFIDLDGTLVKNSSAHFPPYIGESEPIGPNVEIVNQLQKSGKFQIIVTTSRPEKYRAVTEQQLARIGIQYTALIMGLHHSKRIIINDYSKSNPFKSCDSINLKRDGDDLKEILRESLGIDYDEI
jgi:hypothetical protein